jgi:hypothetical protein
MKNNFSVAHKSLACTELGVDKVEDFSGENLSRKTLNYTDVKLAHTTSRIVDPSAVNPRASYKSINDLEADRSRITHHMTPEQQRAYDQRIDEEIQKERQRQYIQQQKDKEAKLHFEKVHRLMISSSSLNHR